MHLQRFNIMNIVITTYSLKAFNMHVYLCTIRDKYANVGLKWVRGNAAVGVILFGIFWVILN